MANKITTENDDNLVDSSGAVALAILIMLIGLAIAVAGGWLKLKQPDNTDSNSAVSAQQ